MSIRRVGPTTNTRQEPQIKVVVQKIAMFEEGIKAGRRTLGPSPFKEDIGSFWGLIETRPFMRALFGLAHTLQDCGRIDEALVHYKQPLRLNPNDNQGVRLVLIPLLMSQDKTKEAYKNIQTIVVPRSYWNFPLKVDS